LRLFLQSPLLLILLLRLLLFLPTAGARSL
jgi:hypothetical protein